MENVIYRRSPSPPLPSSSGPSSLITTMMPEEVEEPSIATATRALLGKEFPETELEADIVDRILAQELRETLTLEEEEQVVKEVHGILPNQVPMFEDPPTEFIPVYLEQLEIELAKIPHKEAYEQAKYYNPEYIQSTNFRLMVLRCERFNVQLAAKKLVWHFVVKKELFGNGDILGRPVKLSDLSEDDMATMRSGKLQLLPERDTAGRPVLVLFPALGDAKTPENFMRACWYIISCINEEEENQRKGFVVVLYTVGCSRRDRFSLIKSSRRGRQGVPRKITGVHVCYDDFMMRPFLAASKLYLMDRDMRKRLKEHYGSHDECVFRLQTYGIPVDHQLIRQDGTISLHNHLQWLQVRQIKESSAASFFSDVPLDDRSGLTVRRFDVLFGRGKKIASHTGNQRCVLLAEMMLQKYSKANKYEKTEITDRVVSIVHESLGRFLKHDEQNGWQEVEREVAREKVSHIFRHLRSKTNKSLGPALQVESEANKPKSQKTKRSLSPVPSDMDAGKTPKHSCGD